MKKKNYIELKTVKDFLATIPIGVENRRTIERNAKFLYESLKKRGKVYLVRFFCPFCENYDTIHQVIMRMEGKIKEKFDKDEPITMMCPKCMERSQILFMSGITDHDIVRGVLKDLAEEERLKRTAG